MLAVRYGGLRLAEVVRSAGLKCQAAAQAVKRFQGAMAQHPDRLEFVAKLKRQISTI